MNVISGQNIQDVEHSSVISDASVNFVPSKKENTGNDRRRYDERDFGKGHIKIVEKDDKRTFRIFGK